MQGWVHWEEKLNASWKVPANEPFYKILVPTVDTTRYTYLLSSMMRAERHVLLTGDVGVGKTSIIFSALASLGDDFVHANLNFSAQTSSTRVSDGFEARVEKRTKDTFAPPGGKKLGACPSPHPRAYMLPHASTCFHMLPPRSCTRVS